MERRIGQCQKEVSGMAALSIAHPARGENNKVDNSMGKSIMSTNGCFCEVAGITTDEANSGMFNRGPKFSVGFECKILDSQRGDSQTGSRKGD